MRADINVNIIKILVKTIEAEQRELTQVFKSQTEISGTYRSTTVSGAKCLKHI